MKTLGRTSKKSENEAGESSLVIRNLQKASGEKTSMRLEPELWKAAEYVCDREKIDFNQLVERAVAQSSKGGRTSAVRVYIVQYLSKIAGL